MTRRRQPEPSPSIEISVDELVLGDDYRLDDSGDDLAELAASIAELGVLQPLLVRPRSSGGGYEVIAGRRRLAASRMAGLERVPCVVRRMSAAAALDATLAENLHRRNLSAVEEAMAYAQLVEQGLTQTAIAARVGRSQKHVSTLLAVLKLPEELREKVHRGEMGYTTALDRWGRRRFRSTGEVTSGSSTHGHLRGSTSSSDDVGLVSHWRRRHDRLLAGVQAILASHPEGDARWAELLERLLKLDLKPFDETGATTRG